MNAPDLQLCPADYFCELQKGEIFPDPGRPLEVDFGCGDGAFLRGMASAHPERDFLGVERLLGRVRKVCRKAQREGLENLKVLRLDSTYVLGYLLPAAGVARVHLLFPDPWPKKKHHKRRLVTQEFCDGLKRVLEPGGEFLFKTDHSEYFTEGLEAVRGSDLFDEIPWGENDFFYAETDFEQLWKGQGRGIYRARFRIKN
ncbi:MAG: tRNA (guanosine(46)-N7)-methyltransferase TrmB [Verrucomicrobiales bacterium]